MRSIAPATGLIDLHFLGHPEYIGCYVLEGGSDLILIDPGPASTLETLEQGLRLAGHGIESVTAVLLTHIHLDHAGASGTMLRRNPQIQLYVHSRGARHMAEPERLIASATRLYGDRMDELWGEFLPVPRANITELRGGESLSLGNRRLEVAYTPGHAVHHVSYFEADTGIAWVGDVAGIRIDNRPFVLPVTPPPDVDLDAWAESFVRLREWRPDILCPTHFGPARPVGDHLREHEERLAHWSARVARDLESQAPDGELAERFRTDVRKRIGERLSPADRNRYTAGGGLLDSWHGLARHLRKRDSKIEPNRRH